MAKKSAVQKQLKREHMVRLKREKRAELKKQIKDANLDEDQKEILRDKLNKLPRNSSRIRLRHRCQLTGRPRGYLRKFQLSRITFRELASQGIIPGVTKSSW